MNTREEVLEFLDDRALFHARTSELFLDRDDDDQARGCPQPDDSGVHAKLAMLYFEASRQLRGTPDDQDETGDGYD